MSRASVPTAVLGGRLLAFCERAQRIACLESDASGDIARMAVEAMPGTGAVLPPTGAWRVARALPHRATAAWSIRKMIAGLNAEIRTGECRPAGERLRDLLAGFPASPADAPVRIRLRLRWSGSCIRIEEEGGETRRTDPNGLVPSVKALLTERVLERADAPAALHGALVAAPRGTTLLLGASGAGKSTLAAACMAEGLGVRCDDLVLLGPDARLSPIPFAVTLKPGSWSALSTALPQLASKPIHVRPDGRRVRYLPLRGASCRPEKIARIVLLERDAPGTALRPVDPALVLAELLEGAHRPDGRLNAAGFGALTAMIAGAETLVLTGGDARACAALLGAS